MPDVTYTILIDDTPAGEDLLDVIQQIDANSYKALSTIDTGAGARTICVSRAVKTRHP